MIFTLNKGVHRIYPAELQLNKANASDNEAAFLDFNLSIHNDIVSKIYDKRDDFDFDIVNFLIIDSIVPRRPSYGVYMYLNLASSHVYTSIIVTNSYLPNSLSKAIGIISSAKYFPNFIVGILN